MKLTATASVDVKQWGPFILMDNEMVSSVVLMLPWPFRGVQIQIMKVKVEDLNEDKEVNVEL